MKDETEKVKKPRFELVEVPSSFVPAIRDNTTDTLIQDQQILTEILNKIDRIERAVG